LTWQKQNPARRREHWRRARQQPRAKSKERERNARRRQDGYFSEYWQTHPEHRVRRLESRKRRGIVDTRSKDDERRRDYCREYLARKYRDSIVAGLPEHVIGMRLLLLEARSKLMLMQGVRKRQSVQTQNP
jgi:hypothetical protein